MPGEGAEVKTKDRWSQGCGFHFDIGGDTTGGPWEDAI